MPEIKKYLNRDGLEEYNSMLPHSSSEMQTYVNDWLDEHPEATTTVQDGAITEPKLADKSVSLRTLADDTVHMLRGAILTGNLSGNVLTADDAYSAPPVALTIEGKSTQDGTPTPDAPVEIVSIEQVNLAFASKNLLDTSAWVEDRCIAYNGAIRTEADNHYTENYSPVITGTYTLQMQRGAARGGVVRLHGYDADKNWVTQIWTDTISAGPTIYHKTIAIPDNVRYVRISSINTITNFQLEIGSTASAYSVCTKTLESVLLNLTQALRSLPDGTHDALSFAYLRPSTRAGWAWYTPTLTTRVTEVTFDGSEAWAGPYNYTSGAGYYTRTKLPNNIKNRTQADARACNLATGGTGGNSGANTFYFGGQREVNFVGVSDSAPSLVDWVALVTATPAVIQYALADAYITTETLNPIELPFTASPDFTIWNDPSTGLQMEYVRNSNIVIQNIEQAIADQ